MEKDGLRMASPHALWSRAIGLVIRRDGMGFFQMDDQGRGWEEDWRTVRETVKAYIHDFMRSKSSLIPEAERDLSTSKMIDMLPGSYMNSNFQRENQKLKQGFFGFIRRGGDWIGSFKTGLAYKVAPGSDPISKVIRFFIEG